VTPEKLASGGVGDGSRRRRRRERLFMAS